MWHEKLDFTLADGTALTITNANVWQGGLSFEQAVSSDGQFELGGTHIGQMNVTLLNKKEFNLLPYPYVHSTKTDNGITWTVHSDGSITINGTATAQSTFYLTRPMSTSVLRTNGGAYRLGLGVAGQSNTTFFVTGTFADSNKENVKYIHNITDIYQPYYEVDTSICGDNGYFGQLYIRVRSGAVMDNVTVYPMLYETSNVSSAYEPYYASHLDQYDFADATCVLSMSSDGETYEQQGVYTVVNCNHDNGLVNITAYDNMNTLSVPYETNLTFPSTYGAMASEICGRTMTFDGSTTAVPTKPEDDNLTEREVLGYIAQACGYNVLCDNLGRFQFVRYDMSGFDTEGSYHAISSLYDFHHSQYPVVITGVKVIVRTLVTSTDPDTGEETSEDVVTEYTAGTDAYQLVIEENPLITTANGQSVADALYALYGNVEFYTGDVSHLSDISIKASDIMKVTDRHNNTYPMLVSRTVISTGSAQNTSSYAEEPARKIVVQPSQMSRLQNSVRQAAIDAQNGKRIASNTNQYFWHTETGTDTGAHITEIPREDFLDDPTNGGGNLLARSNGIAARDGLTELATFGANGSTIGKTDDTHLELDYHSFKAVDKEGSQGGVSGAYFYVSDLRNAQGIATLTMSFEITESMGTSYNLFLVPTEILHVYVNNVETTDYTLNDTRLTINTYGGSATPSAHDEVKIIFTTQDRKAKAYTLGNRNTSAEIGPMSHAEGNNNEATFFCTHAEGANNSAYGACAHVEGGANSAIGNYSHAGGAYSWAFDLVGFVHGFNLQAQNPYEAVFGKYNEKDPLGKYLFAVGNGTSESNRKNALSLTKEGALETSAVRKYVPTWTSGQTPANYHCVVSAGICHLFYQGAAVAHSASDSLGTLPTGARPKSAVYAPFVKMSGNVFGVIGISTTGAITVAFISDTTNTGRIYFNCSFPVVNSYEYQDNSIFN